MGRIEEGDSELRYWEGLYGAGNVWRDSETGELMFNRSMRNDMQGQLAKRAVGKNFAHPAVSPRINVNRPVYPGKGANDEQWTRYALDKNEVAGARIVEFPQIRSGRSRGWDIVQLLRGNGIEYEWGCGCKQDGKGNYYPCGTNYCELDPAS